MGGSESVRVYAAVATCGSLAGRAPARAVGRSRVGVSALATNAAWGGQGTLGGAAGGPAQARVGAPRGLVKRRGRGGQGRY
jgi:hypothetical protein